MLVLCLYTVYTVYVDESFARQKYSLYYDKSLRNCCVYIYFHRFISCCYSVVQRVCSLVAIQYMDIEFGWQPKNRAPKAFLSPVGERNWREKCLLFDRCNTI